MSLAQQIADALQGQESGNSSDPDLLNQSSGSGARGPWQIMPANWPSWARSAGLAADAPWTIDNQRRVVMNQIQRHLDAGYSPEDVAAIWYSGQPLGDNADAPQTGGPSIGQYVNDVMSRMGQTAVNGRAPLADQAVPNDTPKNSPWQPGAASVNTLVAAIRKQLGSGSAKTPVTGTTPNPSYVRTGDYDKDGLAYANTMLDTKQRIDSWIQAHSGQIDPDTEEVIGYQFDPKTGLVYQVVPDGYDTATSTPKFIYKIMPEPSVFGSQYKNASDNLTLLEGLKTKGLIASGLDSAKAYTAAEKDKGAEATRQLDDFIKRVSNLVSLENVPLSRSQTLAETLSSVAKSQSDAGPYGYSAVAPKLTPYTDLSGAIKSLAGTVGAAPKPYSAAVGGMGGGLPPGAIPVGPDPNAVLAKHGIQPGDPGALTGGNTAVSPNQGNIDARPNPNTGPGSLTGGNPIPTPNQGNIDASPAAWAPEQQMTAPAYETRSVHRPDRSDDLITMLANALGIGR